MVNHSVTVPQLAFYNEQRMNHVFGSSIHAAAQLILGNEGSSTCESCGRGVRHCPCTAAAYALRDWHQDLCLIRRFLLVFAPRTDPLDPFPGAKR